MQFLAPIRSATAGRALTRRPFVDRIGNRRVTDDFVSARRRVGRGRRRGGAAQGQRSADL